MKPAVSAVPAPAVVGRTLRPVGTTRPKRMTAPEKADNRPTLADAAKLLRRLDHPEFMRYGRPGGKEPKRASL